MKYKVRIQMTDGHVDTGPLTEKLVEHIVAMRDQGKTIALKDDPTGTITYLPASRITRVIATPEEEIEDGL